MSYKPVLTLSSSGYVLYLLELGIRGTAVLLHFMICHSNKCHRPRTSSCHKEQQGGTENRGTAITASC